MMIRLCGNADVDAIYTIINDAAVAYKGIIPDDRYHDPYMTLNELRQEMNEGVIFWGYVDHHELVGVMGMQERGDVSLIRHAYVRTSQRKSGIGSALLKHLMAQTAKPVLIGTWAAADWAIRFYLKNGFQVVTHEQKEQLLRKYWNIPARQIETSVVLSDRSEIG